MVCHFEEKIQKKLGQRDKKLKYPLNYSLIRKFRVTYKTQLKKMVCRTSFFQYL